VSLCGEGLPRHSTNRYNYKSDWFASQTRSTAGLWCLGWIHNLADWNWGNPVSASNPWSAPSQRRTPPMAIPPRHSKRLIPLSWSVWLRLVSLRMCWPLKWAPRHLDERIFAHPHGHQRYRPLRLRQWARGILSATYSPARELKPTTVFRIRCTWSGPSLWWISALRFREKAVKYHERSQDDLQQASEWLLLGDAQPADTVPWWGLKLDWKAALAKHPIGTCAGRLNRERPRRGSCWSPGGGAPDDHP